MPDDRPDSSSGSTPEGGGLHHKPYHRSIHFIHMKTPNLDIDDITEAVERKDSRGIYRQCDADTLPIQHLDPADNRVTRYTHREQHA